ncbi:hypothetical protein [Marinobacterium arenosum]|uniref:hypothetical protein n=1 Tax=Marinobacterium arenosum TaxID=2862496 RepID=UPI001C978AD6|nr:hypothetical protein [Marinobacterium arenosum]MBY4678765.1 hypothetical protein [Marinobacterium arenosum]
MLQQTLSVIQAEWLGPWLVMTGLGAFHGLNPAMGWLFALSLGLQQRREAAIWLALLPITVGHAASVLLVALIVLAGMQVVSQATLQWLAAAMLLSFGSYKLFNYYRHPRWVGMKVGARELFVWSFLMATAHGAGLMVVPALLGVAAIEHAGHAGHQMPAGAGMLLAIGVHTLAMLVMMGVVAWLVYRKLGLAVLRRQWINFDLVWAIALLAVGVIALLMAI